MVRTDAPTLPAVLAAVSNELTASSSRLRDQTLELQTMLLAGLKCVRGGAPAHEGANPRCHNQLTPSPLPQN